jgi:hypothetical protein
LELLFEEEGDDRERESIVERKTHGIDSERAKVNPPTEWSRSLASCFEKRRE